MAEVSVENVMVEAEKDSFFPPRLWVITYDLRGVGIYNGTQSEYLVTKTEEIVIPPCCGLMAEQNVEFFNNN